MEILSLNNVSKYNKIVKFFEKNKSRPMNEWLHFDGLVTKPGKQGIVGLFRLKNEEFKNEKIIFKMSQYINYLTFSELTVMQGLKKISSYIPHFCKGIGLLKCQVDANYKKDTENPFIIKNKYPIDNDILLCEYIDKSSKFYNYIRNKDVNEDILYSIIKQVLMALCIAQKETKFTHYDLHSFNVMIKKCDKDVVFLYKIDEENQFCVPTLGTYPVIIDYGFSYIDDMKDGPLWPSMAHTDVGFISDRFDWVADPKLFLVTVSDEIKSKRRTKKAKRLRRVVKNIFHPLTIDWSSGWDTKDDKGASDYVLEILGKYNKNSELFKEYDYYCIDLLQTLIILPLQEQDCKDFEMSYKSFIKEWINIENEISNPFYNIYILKNVIDTVRIVRSKYMNLDTRNEAVKIFRHAIYDCVSKISKYCVLKNIHYEKLLCSLLVFGKCLEGVLYKIMNEKMKYKNKEYDKLPLQSIEQIYGVITTNIQDEYTYNKNTKVLIFDNDKKECNMFKLPVDEIDNINDITHLAKGTYIYDLYKLGK